MGWIIKMLLKLFKPFAKMAILEAIFGMLSEETADDTASEDPTEPTSEATEG